jgi:DNA-binding response OmpR family regulator
MKGEKTILLVYNNYNLIKKFESELRRNNYRLKLYDNPQLALREYESNFFNLLLLETRLSNISGFEFYSIIKKIEKVPVCFFTNLTTYYRSLLEIHPNLDINCFISTTISLKDFNKIIENKI